MNGYSTTDTTGNSNHAFASETQSNTGDGVGLTNNEYMLFQDTINSSSSNMTSGSFTFPNSQTIVSRDNSYRDNPLIDESTTMAFGNAMDLHDDLSLPADESSFLPSVSFTSTSGSGVGNTHDCVSMSGILSSSEKIHIADDSYTPSASNFSSLESSQALKPDYGSPHKMSRIDPTPVGSHFVNVEKLINSDNNQNDSKFNFVKFGADSGMTGLNQPNGSELHTYVKTDDFGAIRSGHSNQHSPNNISNQLNHSPIPQLFPNYDQTCQNTQQQQQHLQQLKQQQQMQCQLDHQQLEQQQHHHLEQQQATLHKLNAKNKPCNSRGCQSLAMNFPDRCKGVILKILKQPEAQHRARYMTEGSRGAIKDSLQRGHPLVQLIGWNQRATLEIFIGTDSGKVKPHCFYQACRINGKNASSCKERDYEGTTVIEMELDPDRKMTATIDCVGILKLRNTDVEKRMGGLKNKKKSTKCRLVLRTSIFHPETGDFITLQTTSIPIACTQPTGLPEICKMSLQCAPVTGGPELFAIGKNFIKGFQVKFQEIQSDTGEVMWESLADVAQEYIHMTHFICTIPAYKHECISSPVEVRVIVETNSGTSDPLPFKYLPDEQKSIGFPMSVTCTGVAESLVSQSDNGSPSQNSPHSIVSPEALELVAQIQQQKFSDKDGKIFQIPEGVDFISSRDGTTKD